MAQIKPQAFRCRRSPLNRRSSSCRRAVVHGSSPDIVVDLRHEPFIGGVGGRRAPPRELIDVVK
jgi:hypothetical protein